jgi:diguanylate cyclase (GGDEF)-like protein
VPDPAIDTAARETCYWSLLYDVPEIIGSRSFRFEDTARAVLEAAVGVARAERGLLFFYDRSRDLAVKAAVGIPADVDPLSPAGGAIARAIEDALRTERPVARELAIPGTLGAALRSALALPVRGVIRERPRGEGEPADRRRHLRETLVKQLGAIYVDRGPDRPFSAAEVAQFEAFAGHAARALVLARLYQAATIDPLTGLYTRAELEQNLSVEMTIATHTNVPLALAMVDIDRFEELVYARGRRWADETLAQVAGRVRRALRDQDLAFRYGGGKLIVLLPGADEEGATAAVRRLCEAARAGDVTISAGIAIFPHHADRKGDLVKKADQALFLAETAPPAPDGVRISVWNRGISKYALRTDKLIGIITGDPARDYRNVLLLLDAIAVVNSIREPEHLLSTIVDMMIELTDAERGIVFVPEGTLPTPVPPAPPPDETAAAKTSETQRLLAISEEGELVRRPPAAKPPAGKLAIALAQDNKKRPIVNPEYCGGVVDKVARTGLPISILDYMGEDDPAVEERVRELGLRMVICVPLQVQDRLAGVLYVDSHQGTREVGEADLIFFQALAREIGVALENARLYEENVRARHEVEDLNRKLARKVRKQAHELEDVKAVLEVELKTKYDYDKIVGKSPKMLEIYRLLDRITDTEVPVLIHGESGTGKELVAKAIHYNGPRKRKKFVSVNCAAIAPSLLESELFGHVRGAFTGADRDKHGLFEQADGGTIFLDEVQDMSPGMQRELLRVLQEKEVRRVGGKEVIPVDVRVISATNRDLKDLMRRGQFREDLYYRLNVVTIDLPPLRERKEDIPLLVERFLQELEKQQGRGPIAIEKSALRKLIRHDWPGNVRELQNVIERTLLMLDGNAIAEEHIDLEPHEVGGGARRADGGSAASRGREEPAGIDLSHFEMPYKEAAEAFKAEYIRRVLARHQGNVTRASEESGLVRSSFHKIMRKLDVSAKEIRGGGGG